jgi:hypothetical protein
MNDVLKPPAERDLPPVRAARMRAGLLTAIAAPRPRTARRRLLVAAAAALTLIAGAATTLEVRQEDGTRVLALGPGELDGRLRAAVKQCLVWNQDRSTGADAEQVAVTATDVAVAARRGNESAVLFLTGAGYLACGVIAEPGGGTSSGNSGSNKWSPREWLPGPVQRLSLSSSDRDGGQVAVLGRVSARVDRLVLEHGNGRKTTARIRDGAFGVISGSDDVRKNAALVSYDAAGREIDRRRLFRRSDAFDNCYADPDGTVVYGTKGPADCLPADPWSR